MAEAIAPKAKKEIVGIRPGEKLHEEMITDTDSINTIDLGKYYAVLPSISDSYTEQDYLKHHNASKVPSVLVTTRELIPIGKLCHHFESTCE